MRQYFGLRQHELAAYLGVSVELVKHIEAGRRQPSLAVLNALAPLTQQLPDEPAPAAPVSEGRPEAGPLQERRRYCRLRAEAPETEAVALEKLLAAPEKNRDRELGKGPSLPICRPYICHPEP